MIAKTITHKVLLATGIFLLASLSALANDTIRFTWQGSTSAKTFDIQATSGKSFTVNWGDGATTFLSGVGTTSVTPSHAYTNSNDYIVTIAAGTGTSFTYLKCYFNGTTNLDVTKSTALIYLSCIGNQLTTLDVSKNTALIELSCTHNQLTKLDVAKNIALTQLSCYNNQLSDLDVTKNIALKYLYCSDNRLNSLDLSKNTALTSLWCENNQLTSLDLSKNTALTSLYCYKNALSLQDLKAASEKISNIPYKQLGTQNRPMQLVPLNMALTVDNVFNGSGTTFVVKKSGVIANGTDYTISAGKITFKTSGDYTVEMSNTAITSDASYPAKVIESYKVVEKQELSFTWEATAGSSKSFNIKATAGKMFTVNWGDGTANSSFTGAGTVANTPSHTYTNSNTYTVSITALTNDCFITDLDISLKSVKTLDVSKNVTLESLTCYNNQLTKLDVTKNIALKKLDCDGTQLDSLNISKNVALIHLDCRNNQLTKLDISKNTALTYLHCGSNKLTDLDVSKHTALTNLICHSNQLTVLDVSKNTALGSLECYNNQLTVLDVSKNTTLTTLKCQNNQLTTLDISKNTALTYLSCYNNALSLQDLKAASDKISTVSDKVLGTQNRLMQYFYLNGWAIVDNVFQGINTTFVVTKQGGIAVEGTDYFLSSGYILFRTSGDYSIVVSNPAIVSNAAYPAKVIENYKVTALSVPFIESFEEDTKNQIWWFANGTQTNKWEKGTATAKTGDRSNYISNDDGISNTYDVTKKSIVHFLSDVNFTTLANKYQLKFSWKGMGENRYDYLNVYLIDAFTIPVMPGDTLMAMPLKTCGNKIDWQTDSILLSGTDYYGKTKRLVFTWVNDGSGGTQPPIAIDDISIKALSSDATLKSLSVNPHSLNPAFSSAITNYTVNVANNVTSITLTAEATHPAAIVSGAGTKTNLKVGDTIFNITVTAEDGTSKVYKVTVTRAKSNDATLKSLSVNQGNLSPAFSSATTNYTVSVANNITSITLTAEATHTAAKIGNGDIGTKTLSVGDNTFNITVTAEDGTTTKTYKVTVKRLSNDATLKTLSVNQGSLNPVFNSATTNYTVNVANNITSITLTAEATHPAAKIGNGDIGTKTLSVGDNTFTITVTAEDGTTTKTYKVTVTRAKSSDATLKSLSVNQGILTPAFAPNDTNYTVNVANNITSITVVAEANHSEAVVSGAGDKNLSVGDNTFTITVTAEDGNKKTYTIVVRRKSNNANLSNLMVSQGSLNPEFNPNTVDYTVSVGNSIGAITITAYPADTTAKVSGTGEKTLYVGNNKCEIKVTAEDGTTKTYTVTVNRRTKSSDATLKDLSVSAGSLTPVFNSATLDYTVQVSNSITAMSITAKATDAAAKIEGVGNQSLSVGNNTCKIIVTAEDGTTTKTYIVTVNRAKSSDATLKSLTVSQGSLSPAFNAHTTTYTLRIEHKATTVDITATPSCPEAQVTGSINKVNINDNTELRITVSSEDNTATKVYTIKVKHTYTITPSVNGGGGNILPNTKQTVDKGSDMEFTFTPSSGYQTGELLVNAKPVTCPANKYTIKEISEDMTIVIRFDPVSGINEVADEAFALYPTLTTGKVYIKMPHSIVPEVKVYSIQGICLFHTQSQSIDLSDYPQGIYIIEINGHKRKVVKQ